LYQREEKAKADRTLAASKSAQAEKELATGDPQKAVALYRDAVAALPENAMLQLKLGLALDRTGDANGELEALQKAIQLDPHMAIAHNQIGYLATQSGDYPTAEEHFRKAVASAPAYVEAWVSLAATLGMEHRFPEAQKALESALQLDPKNTNALDLRKELDSAASQAQR
jgi:tetratricopeptide (TPR) repeat protein